MRLVDGKSFNEGRVEIYYAGQWGTICDDNWDMVDAQVVCRSLGFLGATEVKMSAAFGEGTIEYRGKQLSSLLQHNSSWPQILMHLETLTTLLESCSKIPRQHDCTLECLGGGHMLREGIGRNPDQIQFRFFLISLQHDQTSPENQ